MKYIQPYGISDTNAPYVNGDPSIGRAGSIPPALVFENPQREIMHMIEKSGLTGSDNDLYQLLKAIRTNRINYSLDAGTVNNLAVSFDPLLDGYNNGLVVRAKVAFTNTAPSVIDCGPGVRNIVRLDGSPLSAGDMVHGGVACMVYVDNEFQLINPNFTASLSGVTGAPGSGTEVNQYVTNNYMGFQGIFAKEAAGTYDWPVPGGVQKVWLRLWAGGGPGVEWLQDGLFIGGGDGGYVEGMFDVVPGTLMRAVIGAGATPPVSATTGNISYNANSWKTTFGQPSSFGVAGGSILCSCTGGRGCFPDPPGDTDPTPGQPGHGTGGAINRANGIYGRGGGKGQPSDGHYDDYIECTADPGAIIIVY